MEAGSEKRLSEGKAYELDYRIVLPDGTVKFIHLVAHPVSNASSNSPVEFVGTLMDVTERKRAEKALQESEQRFRDFTESASDWYWETGPDHRFITESEQLGTIGDLLQISRAIQTAPREAERTRRAYGIRTQ